jgi:hypothetical protein
MTRSHLTPRSDLCNDEEMSKPADVRALQRQIVGAVVLILVQSGLGMYVDLFVTIPSGHSGSNPSNYLSGSGRSLLWAVEHGGAILEIHTVLGVLLGVMVIGIVARAIRSPGQSIRLWSIFGALLLIGAGFNGASFLDYNRSASSLIMALLAFGAVACFVVVLFLVSDPSHARPPAKDGEIAA